MSTFRSTVLAPLFRLFGSQDQLIIDPNDGSPLGIRNQNGGGNDAMIVAIPLTAAQIQDPTAEMIADTRSTFCLSVAPYTRYQSNGTTLVPLGGNELTQADGIFANLKTVPAGHDEIIIGPNSEVVEYATFTVQSTEGVTVQGRMMVIDPPIS